MDIGRSIVRVFFRVMWRENRRFEGALRPLPPRHGPEHRPYVGSMVKESRKIHVSYIKMCVIKLPIYWWYSCVLNATASGHGGRFCGAVGGPGGEKRQSPLALHGSRVKESSDNSVPYLFRCAFTWGIRGWSRRGVKMPAWGGFEAKSDALWPPQAVFGTWDLSAAVSRSFHDGSPRCKILLDVF